MKSIFVPSSLTKKLGIVDARYDRGTFLIKIKRDILHLWTKGTFWYDGSVFQPDYLCLHFSAVNFANFLFTFMDYETASKEKPLEASKGQGNPEPDTLLTE